MTVEMLLMAVLAHLELRYPPVGES